MMHGRRQLEVVIVGVAIHPHVAGDLLHARDDARRGAETAFVCAHPGTENPPARPLLCLWPDERNSRGKRADDGGEGRAFGHGGSSVKGTSSYSGPTVRASRSSVPARCIRGVRLEIAGLRWETRTIRMVA